MTIRRLPVINYKKKSTYLLSLCASYLASYLASCSLQPNPDFREVSQGAGRGQVIVTDRDEISSGESSTEIPSMAGALAGESTNPLDRDNDGWEVAEDCDDERDDVFPGATERCDAIDNDCDLQVDEDLETVCIALLSTFEPSSGVSSLGAKLQVVGDLDGDGREDLITWGNRGTQRRVIAISAQGEELWAVNGGEGFGEVSTGGRFLGGDDIQVAILDPLNERLILYNPQGQPLATFPLRGEMPEHFITLRSPQRDLLVMGQPTATQDRGQVRTITLQIGDDGGVSEDVYTAVGAPDEQRGALLFNIGDFDEDGTDELLFTRAVYSDRGRDRGVQMMNGASGEVLPNSLFSPPDPTDESFATDLAWGRFAEGGALGFVFGAPGVSESASKQGALYPLFDTSEGFSLGEVLYGEADNLFVGQSLKTLWLPERDHDQLVIGASGVVAIYHWTTGEITELMIDSEGLSIGQGLASSGATGPEGTQRLWISGLSEQPGASRVWVYSIR